MSGAALLTHRLFRLRGRVVGSSSEGEILFRNRVNPPPRRVLSNRCGDGFRLTRQSLHSNNPEQQPLDGRRNSDADEGSFLSGTWHTNSIHGAPFRVLHLSVCRCTIAVYQMRVFHGGCRHDV